MSLESDGRTDKRDKENKEKDENKGLRDNNG